MPSQTALRASQRHGAWVLPAYEDYSFVNVPGTAAAPLGADVGPRLPSDVFDGVETDGVSNVLVVLVDGFGFHRWQRDCSGPFFGTLGRVGTVSPLTTTAPSSTAAAIASVHTAAPPAEHGIFGWDVYLPNHETIVEAFPFTVRADCAGEDRTPPIDAAGLVRADPIYPHLAAAGVDSHLIQPAATLGDDYASVMFRDASCHPYEDLEEAVETVRAVLQAATGPTYTYCYLPQVDAVTHEEGADSAAYHRTRATIDETLARGLVRSLAPETAAETLLVVTADHDMIDTEAGAAGSVDLSAMDAVVDNLAAGPDGRPIPPFGDPRVTHLRLKPGSEAEVREALAARGATTLSRAEVDDLGIFGEPGTMAGDDRCGDLVVCHDDRKLVHDGLDGIAEKIGVHGGLTPREMLVPFATARLSTVQDGLKRWSPGA